MVVWVAMLMVLVLVLTQNLVVVVVVLDNLQDIMKQDLEVAKVVQLDQLPQHLLALKVKMVENVLVVQLILPVVAVVLLVLASLVLMVVLEVWVVAVLNSLTLVIIKFYQVLETLLVHRHIFVAEAAVEV